MQRARKIPFLLIEAIAVAGTVLFVMYATGYFLIPMKSGETFEFGKLAANILVPIDSWGGSLFLTAQPKSPYRLGEGYCYVGAGSHCSPLSRFASCCEIPFPGGFFGQCCRWPW